MSTATTLMTAEEYARKPDNVRGGNVWFISYQKMPKGAVPDGHLDVAPDIVVEVRSKHDRWAKILEKVAEHLNAGVPVVCVLDPKTETARLYFADAPEVTLSADDRLTFPEQLPGFEVRVGELFEYQRHATVTRAARVIPRGRMR